MSVTLNFGQLRAETLGWLDEASATTSDQSYDNVEAALKEAHTRRLVEDNWKFMLWPTTPSLTMVANQQSYSLHQEFLKPYWFRNTTQRVWLNEIPSRNIGPDGIDPINDTDTLYMQLGGYSGAASQPTSASVVTIVSSSAADTGASLAVKVYGDTATGMTWEDITPNGTTPVAGTTSFTYIFNITKPAWTGTMTATSNSGAVTNLTLRGYENSRQYRQLDLLYLPTAGDVVKYRFYRRPSNFGENDTDVPDIPSPFERILVYDALLMLAAYDNRLENGRMNLWFSLRDDLDKDMRSTYQEGQSLEAEPRLIRDRSSLPVRAVRIGS